MMHLAAHVFSLAHNKGIKFSCLPSRHMNTSSVHEEMALYVALESINKK